MANVVVTGATGFLGRYLMPVLEQSCGRGNVVGLCLKNYSMLKLQVYLP